MVAGGVIAAVVGPTLTEWLRDVGGYPLFSLCYASFVGLALMSLLIAVCLPDDAGIAKASQHAEKSATAREPFSPSVKVAMAVAALSYGS